MAVTLSESRMWPKLLFRIWSKFDGGNGVGDQQTSSACSMWQELFLI